MIFMKILRKAEVHSFTYSGGRTKREKGVRSQNTGGVGNEKRGQTIHFRLPTNPGEESRGP